MMMLVGGFLFIKGTDGVDNIGIGLGNIIGGVVTINQVATSHVASIGSFIFVVDGGIIPYTISFSLRR